jgi:hypothetical protein
MPNATHMLPATGAPDLGLRDGPRCPGYLVEGSRYPLLGSEVCRDEHSYVRIRSVKPAVTMSVTAQSKSRFSHAFRKSDKPNFS